MTQGTHPLAANMINQLNRVDVISNNLANANTTGFKEDSLVEGSFNHYLDKANNEGKTVLKESEIMNTVPKIDGDYMNVNLGSISPTGNKLDFALNQHNMFFKVKNSINGNIELTRDGQFKIVDNKLITQNGYSVLDNENREVFTDNENFVSNIAVVSTSFTNLDKIGNNNYKFNDKNELETIINNDDHIVQGAIEKSNVNTIKSMVTLIEAQRKFEQSQKAIAGIDEINQKVIDSIGNNK
ncbi:MAG: flagellar hook-basal body complex protein [Campylobacterota bacterium]|nr:flagellar hook-basal body complex protein [Campylobacterota bacterium]